MASQKISEQAAATTLLGPELFAGVQSGANVAPTADQIRSFAQKRNWAFSTTTADADPGAGAFRLNHATPASATFIYLDDTPAGGIDVGSLVASLAEGAHVYLAGSAETMLFEVSGAPVDGTGYWKIPVTHKAGATLFADADIVVVDFFGGGGGAGRGSINFSILGANDGASPIASGFRRIEAVAKEDGTLTDWLCFGNDSEVDSITWEVKKNGVSIFDAMTPASATEDFEDETDTATTFAYTGHPAFTLTDALAVGEEAGWFATASDFGVDTYAAGTQSGTVGKFVIAAGYKFKVTGLKGIVSNDTGVTLANGSIKFTGTLAAGGTATETLTCNSAGGWQSLAFAAGLDDVWLTELEVELQGGADYVGIDDWAYTYTTDAVRPFISAGTDNTGADLTGWTVAFVEGDRFTFDPGTTGFTFNHLALFYDA